MKIDANTSVSDELDLRIEPVVGAVSGRCRMFDDRDVAVRCVLVDGALAFQYARSDTCAERMVWVQVYLRGFATMKQIAEANSFSLRTFAYWLARYREEGGKGLVDKYKPGIRHKITDKVLRRIYSLRDQRLKVQHIADVLHVSKSAVEQALHARKVARQAAPVLTGCTLGDEAGVESAALSPAVTDSVAAAPGPEVAPEGPSAPVVATPSNDEPALASSCVPASTPPMTEATVPPLTVPELLADEVEACLSHDRNAERLLAYCGEIQDAPPLFHDEEQTAFAGAFLAVAAVAADPFLGCALGRYGQFKAAFYGTRTIFLTLVLMLLLRCGRVAGLMELCPSGLGLVLGLDRSPEVKTVRRRLMQLAERGLGAELIGDVTAARHEGDGATVFIDDHVEVYFGAKRVGKVFSNRTKQVHKGRSEQWAHGSAGAPLLVIESEFNESLTDLMPQMIDRLRERLGVARLDLVFDRAGHDGKFLADLKASGKCDFTLYRRRPYPDVPPENLTEEPTKIGDRVYRCRPYDHDVSINVYGKSGGNTSRHQVVGSVVLREIRLVQEDGRQVAILTTHRRDDVSAEAVVLRPQGRWGNQENRFKYMRENFDLDGLWSYRTEAVEDKRLDHPHPDRKALGKELAAAKGKRNRIYRRYGRALLADGHATDPEAVQRAIAKSEGRDGDSLHRLDEQIAQLQRQLGDTPERETAEEGGYCTLWTQMRLFQNAFVLTADHIEGRLAAMLAKDYARSEDEGRALVAAALRTAGSIRLAPGKLVVQLQPQSSAHRTRAVNALCGQLTALRVLYPGSARVIEFLPTPAPPPPLHHRWNPRPKDAT